MWPFKKKPKAPTPSVQPDDADVIIMPGAMTGDEARKWEAAMRERMGLPPKKRPHPNDPD